MARVALPNPWAFCPHELEAMEPDSPCCAYCDCVEVAEEGDFCSDTCAEISAAEAAADEATTHQLDQRIA
jgi:tRNA A58 N-methylase Trm61